jgi:hypothetical protein
MNRDVLTRFFQSLPLADRRETHAACNELMQRLPRRGAPPHPEVMRLRRLVSSITVCRMVGLECSGAELPQAMLRSALRRREECAIFIQRHVLKWLYQPSGPMPRRLGWEACEMLQKEEQ